MPTPPPVHEPHKIKTVRPIAFPTLEERKRNLSAARLADWLKVAGVPVVEPTGSHAVFLPAL